MSFQVWTLAITDDGKSTSRCVTYQRGVPPFAEGTPASICQTQASDGNKFAGFHPAADVKCLIC